MGPTWIAKLGIAQGDPSSATLADLYMSAILTTLSQHMLSQMMVYVDDMTVHAASKGEFATIARTVKEALALGGLSLNKSKCIYGTFGTTGLKFCSLPHLR